MSWGERLRSLDARWVDAALAGVVAVWFLIELLTRDPRGTDRVATAVAAAVMVAALSVRTRRPALACVAFAAVVVAQRPLDGGLMTYLDSSFAALFALLYAVGRRTSGHTTIALGALLYAATASALPDGDRNSVPVSLLWGIGLCLPPLLVGRALQVHGRVRGELAAAERELAAEDERRAALAVEDERARIAAELQTVLANDVSALVVQAEAVHRVIAVGELEHAAAALRVIEDTGRNALGELRRLLGVLRHDGDRGSLTPQPGVGEIAMLERPRRGDAPEVTVRLDGEPRHAGPGVELAAFWIAQRAVEAAGAAGADAVEVVARWEQGRVVVRVTDDRPVTHAGDADAALVAAIRARADLYGGSVRISRAGQARVLEAALPLRSSEAVA
jgi:signal transduction histidine kinase